MSESETPSIRSRKLVVIVTMMFIFACVGAGGTIMAKGSPLTIVIVALGGAVVGAVVGAVSMPAGGIRTDIWKFPLTFGMLGVLALVFSVLYRVLGN